MEKFRKFAGSSGSGKFAGKFGVRVQSSAFVHRGFWLRPWRQRRDATLERCGDLLLEALAAQRPSAIGGRAQGLDEVLLQRLLEERPVFGLLFGDAAPQPLEQRMAGEHRVVRSVGMRTIAR